MRQISRVSESVLRYLFKLFMVALLPSGAGEFDQPAPYLNRCEMKWIKIILEILKMIFGRKEPTEKERKDREIKKLDKMEKRLIAKQKIACKYHDNDKFNRIIVKLREIEAERNRIRAGE